MMVIPKTVDEFFAEVTRQAVAGTMSGQDAFRGYLEESADTSRACFAAWIAAQRAGLRATFEVQNAVIQASQTMFDAGLQSSPALADRPVKALRPRPAKPGPLRPAKMAKLIAVSTPPAEAPFWPAEGIAVEPPSADDWAASALSFLPPVGIIASGYEAALDGDL